MFEILSAATTDAGTVLALAGDLDLAAADRLCEVAEPLLAVADGKPLTIDFGAVNFVDAAGLGALVILRNAAADARTTLQLRSLPRRIAKLLDLTGLSELLTPDKREASSR